MIDKININYPSNPHLNDIFDNVLAEIKRANIKYWVFGGVGIAGLTGKFIRENQDLDIYVLDDSFNSIKKILTDLCLSKNNSNNDSWKLIHSVIPGGKRWKLELFIKDTERFSVIPIYKKPNGVEFRYRETLELSNNALIQEPRNINEFLFFSPPITILQKLFIFKIDQYIDKQKKFRSINKKEKYFIDSQILFTDEEIDELNLKFQEKYNKVTDIYKMQPLEAYIFNHRPSGWGLYIKKVRLFELKLRGFVNPEYAFGLINYLEDNGKPKINFYQKVKSVEKYLAYSDLIIQEITKNKLFIYFEEYYYNPRIIDFIIEHHKKISLLPKDRVDACFNIFEIIENSNIRDLKLFKNPLVLQLLEFNNPSDNFKEIENIFINTRFSLIEKIIKTFEVLYKSTDLKIDQKQFESSLDDQSSYNLISEARAKSINGEAILNLEISDALKGYKINSLKNIWQIGILAPELLGENISSNETPFAVSLDTIKPWDLETNLGNVINSHPAQDSGEITLVIKNCNQYKLINFDNHNGILFGLPISGIKFIIARDRFVRFRYEDLQELFLEITQNSYYLPVVNESGKLIFTPEMYNNYRKFFSGISRFNGPELLLEPIGENDKSYPIINKISREISKNSARVDNIFRKVDYVLKEALKKSGIILKSDTNKDIDSELLHIGSTSRKTNTPDDFDFDFSIKLRSQDFSRIEKIAKNIKKNFVFKKYFFYRETEEFYQLRVKGVTKINDEEMELPINIDVSFFDRSNVDEYGTNEATIDKLNYIKNNYGQLSYEKVLANIILAKQILKDNSVYKRGKQGGFGGGGLENFILANGGNIDNAFRSFQSAAYENGKRLSYEEFHKKYCLWDAGLNNKHHKHDNFISVLRPNGYEAILNTIEKYFSEN